MATISHTNSYRVKQIKEIQMPENVPDITSLPEIVIPPKPRPTAEIEDDADEAISFLAKFSSSSRLDPELRMALNNISNTVKTLKTTVVRMTEEAQLNHDNLVEVVRSQRLM
jgi:hypothetical protein